MKAADPGNRETYPRRLYDADLPGSNADAYVCESGGVPLWINITSTMEAAGVKYAAEHKLIAVGAGPFNANRYQEALKKQKAKLEGLNLHFFTPSGAF